MLESKTLLPLCWLKKGCLFIDFVFRKDILEALKFVISVAGHAVAKSFMPYAASRKVAASRSNEVIELYRFTYSFRLH
jgi:hypothetical protein